MYIQDAAYVDTVDQERRMSSQPLLSRPKSPHHTKRLAECRNIEVKSYIVIILAPRSLCVLQDVNI